MVDGAAITTRGSRVAFSNERLTVRVDDIEFADGTPGEYTVVDKNDFVIVLPYENEGFWLVEQYRYPLQRRCWEFPQGGWPAGHSGTPLELATLELREETGFTADRVEHLGRLDVAPGYATNSFDVFLATGLTPGPPHREATEADMVQAFVPEDRLPGMIASGDFADANCVAALALLSVWRTR